MPYAPHRPRFTLTMHLSGPHGPFRRRRGTVVSRAEDRPEGSYTVRLLDDPNLHIKRLGEETAELIQALVQGDRPRAMEAAADLVHHVLTALLAAGVGAEKVLEELEGRR